MTGRELLSQNMIARNTKPGPFADYLVTHYGQLIKSHLHGRGNLGRDDLEYLVEKMDSLKDERLKSCVATLIGWGDEERAEVETFCAIALEVMRTTPPSRLHAAARLVEIKSLSADQPG